MGSGIDGILYKFSTAMATRTCSTSTTTMASAGSMPTMASLATSGTATIGGLSRKSFHFSLNYLLGEFCFNICPLQPPSIFPISSRYNERAIYFLLSKDLISHKTISIIFRVSSLRIVSRIHGNFSSFGRKVATEIASIVSINKVSILCPRVCLCNLGSVW